MQPFKKSDRFQTKKGIAKEYDMMLEEVEYIGFYQLESCIRRKSALERDNFKEAKQCVDFAKDLHASFFGKVAGEYSLDECSCRMLPLAHLISLRR